MIGDTIWAWVGENPEPVGEGLIAVQTKLGMTPLVAFKYDNAAMLRDYALAAGKVAGIPVKLVKYSREIVVERHENDA